MKPTCGVRLAEHGDGWGWRNGHYVRLEPRYCTAPMPCGFHDPAKIEARRASRAVTEARERDRKASLIAASRGPYVGGIPVGLLLRMKDERAALVLDVIANA